MIKVPFSQQKNTITKGTFNNNNNNKMYKTNYLENRYV